MADNRPDSFYQTVNFHFKVDFNFEPLDGIDVRFQSVTGLDATLDTETIKEGGENRFEHVIPVRRKYGPLTLKRGLLKPKDSKITEWLKQTFDGEMVKPIATVNISLLAEDHQPLMHWTINNVWPRSWKIGELNAERGEVLIETLELNYNRLIFSNS
jgi:phage tail-like protein